MSYFLWDTCVHAHHADALMETVMLTPVQKKFIWAGVVCLSLLALFPPWKCTSGSGYSGYGPIFYQPYSNSTFQIDYPRLLIPMGVVVTVTLTGFFLAGRNAQSGQRSSEKK
jgi:hypothetical protein